MKSFKIFTGTILFMLLLFVLLSSAAKFNQVSTIKQPSLAYNFDGSLLDPEKINEYQHNQQELKAALKAYFEKAIAVGDIIGAGVSIVKGDSIIVADGFGKRKVNAKDGIDGETVFRLGSISKGFAGVLAADLNSEGKLHFNDKVTDYIPEFKLGNKENTDKITLATILSHTSGTPYHSFTNLVEAGLPLKDIAKRFNQIKPIGNPGLSYSYQNAMFALSAEMMQRATGEAMTTSLNQKFFKPLGMTHTSMDYKTLLSSENTAVPHVPSKYGWKTLPLKNNYFNAVAAGGISSTPNDMGKWMRFLLGHNPEIMNQASFEEAFHPFIECKEYNKYYQRWPGHVASYYGFGWRIHKFIEADSRKEKMMWHHGGSVNSYRNEIALYPEADLGICVLLNSNSKLARHVIPDLYQMVKDIYNRPKSSIALTSDTNIESTLN